MAGAGSGGVKDHPSSSLLSTAHQLAGPLWWWALRGDRARVVAACALLSLALLLLYVALIVIPTIHSSTHAPPSASDALLAHPSPAAGATRTPHHHPTVPLLDPLLHPTLPSSSSHAKGARATPDAAATDPQAYPITSPRVVKPASTLRWFAPFNFHPGVLSSVPPPYSYTASELAALFELQWVQAPIARRAADGTKVVMLLMTRNSADWLLFFLEHHVDAVDSVVVLDDDSDDATLRLLHQYGAQMKVELLMRKRQWLVMNEWPDRNLLVQAARAVQATHWIMLDIDELLSYNCVRHRPRGLGGVSDDRDEALLSEVFRKMNESRELMVLEAVELWGNAHQQRVGLMSRWRFATYDQFSHLHPVPLPNLHQQHDSDDDDDDDDAFSSSTQWPPSPLHPSSLYDAPPYITQGQRLPKGGSAHVGRIPEPIFQHATQQRKQRRRHDTPSSTSPSTDDDEAPSELRQCRVLHHRFVNDFQFVFKGAFYESRGLSHVMEELQAKGEWQVGEPIPPAGHSLLELTKRAYAIMGGVYRPKASSNGSAGGEESVVLTAVLADEWLGPSFLSLLPLFMELKPWRVLQMMDAVELYGLELFAHTRFMSRIHWAAVVRQEIEEAQQPIYSLPLLKQGKSRGRKEEALLRPHLNGSRHERTQLRH